MEINCFLSTAEMIKNRNCGNLDFFFSVIRLTIDQSQGDALDFFQKIKSKCSVIFWISYIFQQLSKVFATVLFYFVSMFCMFGFSRRATICHSVH